MGMVYKRGEMFWIKYYSGGKPIRESTDSKKQKETERFLKDREGRVAMGATILPKVQKTTVDELLIDLKAHYETTGQRTFAHTSDAVLHGPTGRGHRRRCADILHSASAIRGPGQWDHQP